jgi:hypothetical protein
MLKRAGVLFSVWSSAVQAADLVFCDENSVTVSFFFISVDDPGSSLDTDKKFFSSSEHQDGFPGTPIVLFSGCWGSFSGGGEVKRTGHRGDHYLHLVPRLRVNGAIPVLPNTPSRRGQGHLCSLHFINLLLTFVICS